MTRLLSALLLLVLCSAWGPASAETAAERVGRRIAHAEPGDVITLSPGDYVIDRQWTATTPGTADHPIVLRAGSLGQVRLISRVAQALVVDAPYWIIENLDIRGACHDDGKCDHAIHVVGRADHVTIRNNRLHDFNAMIKGNGRGEGAARAFPDHVTIEGNALFNGAPRHTTASVALIDVVGGRHWTIRDNFIADFAKSDGDRAAHGAFLKGNSSDGVFERNLVMCSWRHRGGARVGLSFGGGGVGDAKYCEGQDCSRMHQGGIMRNNVIMNCSDVGIYLNRASGSRIYNNLLYDTVGIDVRYRASSADIRNNIVFGGIRNRDGGTNTAGYNLPGGPWYVDPIQGNFAPKQRRLLGHGEPLPEVTDDFCGHPRPPAAPDVGPIQYDGAPCDVFERIRRAQAR